jgi:hypothetical protein
MNERRGQTSLEYVVTYGWAFLVLLVVIGSLAYFGIITPSKWVPDKCDLGNQLDCVDYQLISATVVNPTGIVNLFVQNSFGKNITIVSVYVKQDTGSLIGTSHPPAGSIGPGATATMMIDSLPGNYLKLKSKQRVNVVITFQKTGPPLGSLHNLTGFVYATVQ